MSSNGSYKVHLYMEFDSILTDILETMNMFSFTVGLNKQTGSQRIQKVEDMLQI